MVRLSVLAALGALVAQGPSLVPSFARTVLQDFDAWDRDHDGILTEAEVDRAALNPSVHGEDAAALAALHTFLTLTKEPPQLTKAWFAAYRPVKLTLPKDLAPGEAKRLRKAYNATPDSLQSAFSGDLRRLRKSGNASLFAEERPELADIRQGALGDCYMLAPLGAMVHRDPEQVQRMFRSEGDGGYDVLFGDGKTVKVAPPTDAEIAMGGSATTNGLWVRVVEKAYGSRKFAEGESETRIARDGMSGGNPGVAGQGFTGHRFQSVRLVNGYQKAVPDITLVPLLERLRRDLASAQTDRRLVLAGTSHEATPTSINGNHAYAVFGYDASTDTITLWNPHGNDFTPKGPEGFENGFRRVGGVFSMPLPLFARAFSRIAFEENALAPAKG